ncbi:MAG: class I SAM-dependent methyltransferase [Natronomonas sp.]
MALDEEQLNQHLQTAVADFGATAHAPLVVIGDELGLYETLADEGPLTSAGLSEKTDTAERYLREWLRSQAAGGYVTYHPETNRYSLTPEQAAVLSDENSPAFMVGNFQVALSAANIHPQLTEAFRTGGGVGWHEHDADLFHAIEYSWRPQYAANIVDNWIPALDGVVETLETGGHVADIGCGHGASTIVMAEAFPESTFVGIDYHEPSIAEARERAEDAGVADHVEFEVATAKSYNGGNYDFVTTFDAFHDMGDPVGAASHIHDTLTDDGTWMLVELFANDRVEDNLNPMGRAAYSISTLICTPCALNQEAERVLGAQAGEASIREVVTDGGFSRLRRAAETPLNLVFEAKP